MARIRRFYGHGSVPPTGLRARAAAAAAAATDVDETVDTIETIEGTEGAEPTEIVAEAIDLPDTSWKVPAIDAFAEEHGIEFDEGAKKPEKLATIEAWAAALPELSDDHDDQE